MNLTIKNGIIITITVLLVLIIVYFTTAFLMTGEIGFNKSKSEGSNDTSNSENRDSVSSLYNDMIIASRTFEQEDKEYKVIFFSQKDLSENLKTLISSYDSSISKLYKVNTDETINKYVISDESNPNATDYSELKINDTTLLTITNGIISSYVVGEENVANELK